MDQQERRGWIIVGAIFITYFFIWGASNGSGVFFVPVVKYFGWSRAKMSIAISMGWVTGGIVGPIIGWMVGKWCETLAMSVEPPRCVAALSGRPNEAEFVANRSVITASERRSA